VNFSSRDISRNKASVTNKLKSGPKRFKVVFDLTEAPLKFICSQTEEKLRVYKLRNKYAQINLGTGPRRCESLPRGGSITLAKVVAGRGMAQL